MIDTIVESPHAYTSSSDAMPPGTPLDSAGSCPVLSGSLSLCPLWAPSWLDSARRAAARSRPRVVARASIRIPWDSWNGEVLGSGRRSSEVLVCGGAGTGGGCLRRCRSVRRRRSMIYSVSFSCDIGLEDLESPSPRGMGDIDVVGIGSGRRGSGVSGGTSHASDVSYAIVVRIICKSIMTKSNNKRKVLEGTLSV